MAAITITMTTSRGAHRTRAGGGAATGEAAIEPDAG
jgi:hypothetical protein